MLARRVPATSPMTSAGPERARSFDTARALPTPTDPYRPYLRKDLAVRRAVEWAVQDGEVDPDACEPPVPRGLGDLSAPLVALVEFLRIDQDLLAVAAESSGEDGDDAGRFREWVQQLPAGEQQRWPLRAADNPNLALGSALLAEFRRAHPAVADRQQRTVAQLLARAEELEDARKRDAIRQ